MAQDNQNTIDYLYDAAGTKLRKVTSSDRAAGLTTDYSGPFVYEDSKPAFIRTSEGRIVPDHDTYAYEYFLRVEAKRKSRNLGNHLGNTRAVFNEQGEVLQDNSYYPFGGIMEGLNYTAGLDPENKYLYNGKEYQDDFGLDWFDYGARFYDASLARFHTLDPKSEDYYFQTPYAYAALDPIKYIDYNGEGPISGLIGMAIDYGVQVAENYLVDGQTGLEAWTDVSGKSIAISGATSFVGVGIVNKVNKVAKLYKMSKTTTALVKIGTELTTDAAASATKQLATEGNVDLKDVAIDATAGQLIDKPVSNAVKGELQTSQTAKTLHRQADRAQRVANGSRESRQVAADKATQKAESYGAGRAAATGAASSNAASTTVKQFTEDEDND